ncbi:MAG: AI-2E family transporter [Planctomycetota bacterium]|jgi:predicted PurR-regulated permease PerM
MLLDDKPYTLDRIARIIITIIILCAMVWLLHYLSDVLIPFAVALLLAYLINPLVQLVQKKISNRAVAVVISLGSIIVVVVLVLWLMIPRITEEMNRLVNIVTNIVEISQLEDEVEDHLPDEIWEPLEEFIQSDEVQEFFSPENRQKIIKKALSKVLPGVWGVMTGTIALILEIVGLVIILLYLFFLLLDYDKVKQWRDLIPPSYRDRVSAFVKDFESAMSQYFRGQALVAFLSGILFAVGFVIVGLPLAVLLGLFFGLLNMVPYLQILGFIPAFLLAAVHCAETGQNFWTILGFTALVVVVVQLIQDIVLVPRIMGKALGLSPAMILLSLSIWGKLLGMLGLIIALPMTFLLLAYYRRFLAARAEQGPSPP